MSRRAILPSGRPNPIKPAWLRWRRSAKSTTGGNTVLNQDFKEFIQSLNDNGVRYLVIGGYAVALHGHPRYTKDMDVWIEMTPENAAKLVKALRQFGFDSLELNSSDFLTPGRIVQLGEPPNRIDLITTPSGVDFPTCYASRVEVVIDDVKVNVIDLENLKKNKKATGRLQDLADLENLQ
jgi:predicted nucleotidyltransferase